MYKLCVYIYIYIHIYTYFIEKIGTIFHWQILRDPPPNESAQLLGRAILAINSGAKAGVGSRGAGKCQGFWHRKCGFNSQKWEFNRNDGDLRWFKYQKLRFYNQKCGFNIIWPSKEESSTENRELNHQKLGIINKEGNNDFGVASACAMVIAGSIAVGGWSSVFFGGFMKFYEPMMFRFPWLDGWPYPICAIYAVCLTWSYRTTWLENHFFPTCQVRVVRFYVSWLPPSAAFCRLPPPSASSGP